MHHTLHPSPTQYPLEDVFRNSPLIPALLAQGDESAMNLEGVCLTGHNFPPQHSRDLGVNFREFLFRDRPKSLGSTPGVALQTTVKALLDPFRPPPNVRIRFRSLLGPLFGQSLHAFG
jgi:hypothetical protein